MPCFIELTMWDGVKTRVNMNCIIGYGKITENNVIMHMPQGLVGGEREPEELDYIGLTYLDDVNDTYSIVVRETPAEIDRIVNKFLCGLM